MADLPQTTPRRHREMLILASLVIVASFLLQVAPDGDRVSLRNAPSALVPPTCVSRQWFGVRCPGCGLTRSFVYLAHGDWWSSWKSHRIGWLLAAATLAQVPYRLHEIYRPRKRKWLPIFSRWFGWALLALLIGNWLVDMILTRLS
jgi:hypothetical protein